MKNFIFVPLYHQRKGCLMQTYGFRIIEEVEYLYFQHDMIVQKFIYLFLDYHICLTN